MESAEQEKDPVKTESSCDSVSLEVIIKDEPPSDDSVEVKPSFLGVYIKEEILNTEASCSNATEEPLDVTVKVERVKEECGVSACAAAEGLYAGHAVTGELVLGPTLVKRRKAFSKAKGRAPQEEQGKKLDTYRCDHCGYKTTRKCALVGHMRTHTSDDTLVCKNERTEKSYKCGQCSYATKRKYHLLEHKRIHTGEKPYKCGQCSYAATRKEHLLRHEILHTGEKPYKCGQCSFTTVSKHDLRRHERIHTGEKSYKCDRCSYTTVSKSYLRHHESIHSGERPYKCDQCSYSTARKVHLLQHEKIHSGEKPYKCDQCSYAAVQKYNLIAHERMHTDKKPYKCGTCSYATVRKSNLILHYKTHTSVRRTTPYKCDRCSYAAARKSHLIQHYRIHTGDKPYKCDQCCYAAVCKSNLIRHERMHTGERLYKCDRCSFNSTLKAALISHARLHSRERPFEFDQCKFASRENCKLKRVLTEVKPYKDGHCSYASNKQSSLTCHEGIHTGEKQDKCGQYRFASSYNSNLRVHEGKHTEASATSNLTNSGARALIDHDHTYVRAESEPTTDIGTETRSTMFGGLSESYGMECGVRQGGYMNELIVSLSSIHIGCHVDGVNVNNLSYADMVLLSASVSGMRKLLQVCEDYAQAHGLRYNVSKSQYTGWNFVMPPEGRVLLIL